MLKQNAKEEDWIEENKINLSDREENVNNPDEEFKMVYSDDNYKIMKVVKAEKG